MMSGMEPETRRQMAGFIACFVFVLGSCIGSFLNVVAWRLPRGESLSHPPSHCPKCGHPLAVWQNVPILGWLVLRGRCFYCKAPISVRYPVVELCTALLFTAVWMGMVHAGLPWPGSVRYLFMAGILIAAAIIDAEHGFIPDKLTITGAFAALVAAAVLPSSAFFPGCMPENDAALAASLSFIPDSWTQPGTRGFALLSALLGVAAGALFPALARTAGIALLGMHPVPLPESGAAVAFAADGLRIGGEAPVPIDDVIGPKHEACEIRMTEGRLVWRGEGGEQTRDLLNQEVRVERDGVEVGELFVPAADLLRMEGKASRMRLRREVLGWGDVKLMAMTGAFLGPLAVLWVTLVSALAATAAGCALLPFRKGATTALRYGPYIAAASLVVFFFGNDLVLLYARVILGSFFH